MDVYNIGSQAGNVKQYHGPIKQCNMKKLKQKKKRQNIFTIWLKWNIIQL